MYEMKCRVRYSEITEKGDITLTGLINLLQDCATMHSQDNGYDGLELSKEGMGWFVTDYQIHINRLPRLAEYVIVQTFPYGFRGMMGSRHFKIFTDEGELLVTANSIWVFMDLINQRPKRITEEMKVVYGQDEAPDEDFGSRKIPLPEKMVKDFTFTVTKAYVDINHHMNNGKYVEIAQTLIPKGFEVKRSRIEYKMQAVEGDDITLYFARENNRFVIVMRSGDDILCVLEFEE